MGNDDSERTVVGSEMWYKFIAGMIYKIGMVFVLVDNRKFRVHCEGSRDQGL